jgi:hypothetical protein
MKRKTPIEQVVFRLPAQPEIPIVVDHASRQLQHDAMYWAYVVRSRRRWAGSELQRESPANYLLSEAQLESIAAAGLVEVDVPYLGEDTAWALRVLPWEHLLSQATKRFRGERPLTVIRRLRGGVPTGTVRDPLRSVMVVESAPAGLDKFYDVRAESDLMLSSLGLTADAARLVRNPAFPELRVTVANTHPTLVHLAGVDTHQAAELLQLPEAREQGGDSLLDGFALRGATAKRPDLTSAFVLSQALTAGTPKPELVLCNFYNSAGRTGALTVAHGARAAIGYQDFIEDTLAAAFCTTFYRALRAGGSLLDSFNRAIATLRQRPARLEGACVVLWTADSLVDTAPARTKRARPASTTLKPSDQVRACDRIRVEAKPRDAINYSLLHNRRSLFKVLDIYRRDVTGPIDNIEINVFLYVGEESFPFRLSLTLKDGEDYLPLAERVVVPLTSAVIRTQSESVQSSLFLQVRCAGEVVHADTSRVQLCPVDEWADTDENRWWLPSFVLPRDPGVAKVIDRSQRYLMAMADDPSAGFDGYQSVDESADTWEGRYGPVDLQVRAIWSALLYDFGLHYINPPPSYAASHQRLRTPADVIRGQRGTCIDLALLVAACLEYVDIYPVVFLLEGHSFPGYWRSQRFHEDFRQVKDVPLPETAEPDALRASERTTVRFEDAYALKNFYEARDLVAKGQVVPLETVWLTSHGPFADAVEEGRKNLRRAREFDSMIDVALARARNVTPLPILARPE